MMLAQVLKERLKDRNLAAVARTVGVPRSLLHDWTHAKRVPSLSNIHHLVAIAAYFNISLEELLLGKKASEKIISSVRFQDGGREYKIKVERIG